MSQREAAYDANLRRRLPEGIEHEDVDASPAFQNDGGVFRAKGLVQDRTLGLYPPVRQLGSVIEIAIDLINHLTKLSPFLDEERSLAAKRSQMLDRFSSKRGHLESSQLSRGNSQRCPLPGSRGLRLPRFGR